MSYLWSRRNSHRTSSRRRRRRRSVRSTSSYGVGLLNDQDDILQLYLEGGGQEGDEDGEEDEPRSVLDKLNDHKDMIDNVKNQPWHISKKLHVLSLARRFIEQHEGRLSRREGYQQKGQQMLKQVKRWWNNLVYWMTPWEMRIKRIESHFGSVVTSYFIFLRWLLWINLWLTIMQLCFVIVPEMLVGDNHGTTDRKTVPQDEMQNAYDLKTIWDAEGILRYSLLFYGYYGNSDFIGNHYRLPLAYLLTSLVSFAYSFIVVLKKMASNSRQSRMSNKDEQFTFSWKLFTDWDFMVGNAETANNKHASIVTTFKAILTTVPERLYAFSITVEKKKEAIIEEQEKGKEQGNKYLLVLLRVVANVIIVVLLAVSAFVIQLFVDASRRLELIKLQNKDFKAGFWAENELTIIMTLIATLFPTVLDLISLMEKYHPRTSLRLQLARIFVLNLLNLYTLFIALYNKQQDLLKADETRETDVNSTACGGSLPSEVAAQIGLQQTTGDGSTAIGTNVSLCYSNASQRAGFCWETMIGQEVFKLTVMDLIFMLGQIVLIDVLRSWFVKYCNSICCWDLQKKFPEYPDFKTAENLLHLINNQGVIWLGSFFSPGLALLNLFKLLLMMYVRCWTVMVCNVPQERIFRASRSNNFYFALLLVMLFLCMLPPLFAIVGIEPSPTCGPFSGLDKMYHVLTNTMETELPESINSILNYAASPGVIAPVFMLLGMTIYYLVSVGRSLRDANNELRMMLEYERTEGRKKVYAMADAKRGLDVTGTKADHKGQQTFASAASSVLKAARMARALSAAGSSRKLVGQSLESGKVAHSFQPTPSVPVAIVKGKRSLKRSSSLAMNVVVPWHHQSSGQLPPLCTGDHISMVRASQVDTESSSDEEDNSSLYSSPTSAHSGHFPENMCSTTVDFGGHLMRATMDDAALEMVNESTEVEKTGHVDASDNKGLFGRSLASVDRHGNNDFPQHDVEQAAARLPSSPRPSPSSPRPAQKLQSQAIPRITVVDFGENFMPEGDGDSYARYLEPEVTAGNSESVQGKLGDKVLSRADVTGSELETSVAVDEQQVDANHAQNSLPKQQTTTRASNKGETSSSLTSHTRQRFSNLLARFKKLEV